MPYDGTYAKIKPVEKFALLFDNFLRINRYEFVDDRTDIGRIDFIYEVIYSDMPIELKGDKLVDDDEIYYWLYENIDKYIDKKYIRKIDNIVKQTCKELGITQKELAERIGVAENTVSQWSRGVSPLPQWAVKTFELLKIETKYNTIKRFFSDLDNK
ncbi:MAG: helix-turn-helix transcriptional regulator [Campylobacteraceae bacterium]|jgi:DNA-binding XRE family transcriptional regulator|nr:helix-turn-helix transcriptional regulator [Campylobacteraceae bacterium]